MIKSNTCLAVLRDDNGKLWFAGDRRITWNAAKAIKGPRPKVTKRDGILLAGTGVSCICDLVTDQCPIPSTHGYDDTYSYMTLAFVPVLLSWLRSEGWVKEDARKLHAEGRDDDDGIGATIIIGVDSDLYELDLSDKLISIDAIDAPYAAGCGGQLALGSLLTTEGSRTSPKNRLIKALQVAAKVSPGCDDNIDVIHN